MTMTRNLGDSLHRNNGVRVNQINPGWVLTEKEIDRKKEHGLKDNWYEDLPDRLVFPLQACSRQTDKIC